MSQYGSFASRALLEAILPDGELPLNFVERVAALSASTIVHVPTKVRGRLANTMAATLLGMARGSERASLLEFARSKLLLGPIPRFRSKQQVLTERFVAWEEGQFESLLVKAEEAQFASREKSAAKRRNNEFDPVSAKTRRAKQLVLNGAYSKAVTALISNLADLTPSDEQKWADELLPGSQFPEEAVSEPAVGVPTEGDSNSRDSMRHALRGIRFGALSAAGQSGCRPEHSNDALSAQPRATASRLLRVFFRIL